MAKAILRCEEIFLCVVTMKSAQQCVIPWHCQSNPSSLQTDVCKNQAGDKQGQGIQLPLKFAVLSFKDIVFAILISNGVSRILLTITLLVTQKKIHHSFSVMHQGFVQKVNLSLTFRKGRPYKNSGVTLPSFSILLVAKCWAHGSSTSHSLTLGSVLLQHNFYFILFCFGLLEFAAVIG